MIAPLSRFLALPLADQGRTFEAVLLLLVVRMTLALLPLTMTLRLFGIKKGQAAGGRIDLTGAHLVSEAVARAARHVPFRAVCLQQAFAALLMLRRRGLAATVHLGVIRDGQELKAHAWSRCGEMPVTGAAAAADFAPVAVFSA